MEDEKKAVVVEWKPLYDKILVKRFPAETRLGETLVAAEKYQKKQNSGRVLRVGDGRYVGGFLQPLVIRPGHIVLFSQYAGVELQGEDPDLLVLREDEILAWHAAE